MRAARGRIRTHCLLGFLGNDPKCQRSNRFILHSLSPTTGRRGPPRVAFSEDDRRGGRQPSGQQNLDVCQVGRLRDLNDCWRPLESAHRRPRGGRLFRPFHAQNDTIWDRLLHDTLDLHGPAPDFAGYRARFGHVHHVQISRQSALRSPVSKGPCLGNSASLRDEGVATAFVPRAQKVGRLRPSLLANDRPSIRPSRPAQKCTGHAGFSTQP